MPAEDLVPDPPERAAQQARAARDKRYSIHSEEGKMGTERQCQRRGVH